MGIPDQPINLSGLSQLETAVICYYMQTLPIVSSNNSKLSTLKVKRYRPENAVDVGGSEIDEELIEWTALPSDQCIHSVDWSVLRIQHSLLWSCTEYSIDQMMDLTLIQTG